MTSALAAWRRAAPLLALFLSACDGTQSALAPQSAQAERVTALFWAMTYGGAAILLFIMLLTAIALFATEKARRWLGGESIIIGGGIVFPVVTLSALLVASFIVMRIVDAPRDDKELEKISIVGERWWWRVVYRDEAGQAVESANELRLPVGRPVRIELTSADVIHSFWAPKLAGKLDMIPGRVNVLTLTATETGVSRGQCAEYCGGAHAMMAFDVVVMTEPDYRLWLRKEAQAATSPRDAQAQRGERLFEASGCGGCHRIRGTQAQGVIGPDLTHIGGRMSLAAATLVNDAASLARWIRDSQHIKPGNLMPPYRIFTDEELAALAAYLAALR